MAERGCEGEEQGAVLGMVEEEVGKDEEIETGGRCGSGGRAEVGEQRDGGGAPEVTCCGDC